MTESDFIAKAQLAGITQEAAAFMYAHLAQRPHTHTARQIIVDPSDGETLEDFVVFVDEELTPEDEREPETEEV